MTHPIAGPKRLAIVLARQGSKRLPGKNIKSFGGKPLIAWVLEAALASGCFSRVLVSTDSPEIAEISRKAGAWAPFLRPPELASDTASSLDALVHAVEWVETHPEGFSAEIVTLIQPTSPFLRPPHIQEAMNLFEEKGFSSLSSMRKAHDRPEWMFSQTQEGKAIPREPASFDLASNKLPPLFLENGALYIVRRNLLAMKTLYDLNNHGMYVMSERDSIDIDTQDDWNYAEYVLSAIMGRGK